MVVGERKFYWKEGNINGTVIDGGFHWRAGEGWRNKISGSQVEGRDVCVCVYISVSTVERIYKI